MNKKLNNSSKKHSWNKNYRATITADYFERIHHVLEYVADSILRYFQ